VSGFHTDGGAVMTRATIPADAAGVIFKAIADDAVLLVDLARLAVTDDEGCAALPVACEAIARRIGATADSASVACGGVRCQDWRTDGEAAAEALVLTRHGRGAQ
jgi:hypothetical protein